MDNPKSSIELLDPRIVGASLHLQDDGSVKGNVTLTFPGLDPKLRLSEWLAHVRKHCDWDLSDIKWQVVSK